MSGTNENESVKPVEIILDESAKPFVIEGALTAKYGRVRVKIYPDVRNPRKQHTVCNCCKNLCPREVNLLHPIDCLPGMRNTLRKCDICGITYPLN